MKLKTSKLDMLTQIGVVIHKIENQILDTCLNSVEHQYHGASRKQSMVTLSSTESEYIALTEAAQEAPWMRRLLEELDQEVVKPTVLFEDNQSCIKLLQNEKSSHRTKHVAKNFILLEIFTSLRNWM